MEIDIEMPSGREENLAALSVNNEVDEGNVVENTIERVGNAVNLNSNSNKGVMSPYVPRNGMEFETKEAAYSFYREYARSVGFGITIKSSRRSKKSGKFIDIKIVCSRFGNKRQTSTNYSPRTCPRTDCKASLHIKRRFDGKWFVHSFVEEHNHDICADDFCNALRGRNKQNVIAVCQRKGLQLALDERDVQIFLDYLMVMQAENPGFYYVVDFDKEFRMKNVFWVDSKGRHDYIPFSDVVYFDTYYIKNKYNIPFVPVVGINHHFQFILLGCALIGDETSSTFVWLMQTWLKAVGGQRPKVVITDTDKSLSEAIVEVFPDASHCFCPWHVFRDVGPNLSHKLSEFYVFMREFEKCTFKSGGIEEFEKRWHKMVTNFDLKDDEWMQSLYEDRRKWIPAYMKDIFLGGFCTLERSQSVASVFEKYLHKGTMVEEFINHYKIFLHVRCEEEAKAEIQTHHTQTTLISLSPFEKQLSKVYTHAIYQKFEAEVLGIVSCNVTKDGEDERTIKFRVDDIEERQSFIVAWNKGRYDISCLCHLFEYNGFLCRHALSVLQLSGFSTIPSNYILKRWTRNAKIRDITNGPSTDMKFRVQRLNDLCKLAIKLGEEGSFSGKSYHVACYALDEALNHCVGINNSVRSVRQTNKTAAIGVSDIRLTEESNMVKASKTKKVSKKQKIQTVETLSIGIEDSGQDVERLNSRSCGLDSSYIPQQEPQGMELGLRTPIDNGYYGAPQRGQGQDHLNSLSSMRDYGDQLSLHGVLGQLNFRASSWDGCFHINDNLNNENSVSTMSKHLHD